LTKHNNNKKKENRKKRKESVYQLAWLRLIDAHASKVGERVIGLETKSYPRAPSDKRKSNITEDYFFFLLSFIGWLHHDIK
jgi:DNA topoisomerase IB